MIRFCQPLLADSAIIGDMVEDADDVHDYDAKLYVGGFEVASLGERVPPELLAVFTDDMYRTRTATEAAHPPRIEPGDIVYEFASAGPVIADRLNILGFTPDHVLPAIDDALHEARDLRAWRQCIVM
jgi:hypothetical protein